MHIFAGNKAYPCPVSELREFHVDRDGTGISLTDSPRWQQLSLRAKICVY